jgi:hypothetical protein
MPHISASSSEELTYNAMLQLKVDYLCHSWSLEEATRTQQLLWYRKDLLERYGYAQDTQRRCENMLWRLQYMMLPQYKILQLQQHGVSHIWRNQFEKYNTPLIGPVFLAEHRWRRRLSPPTSSNRPIITRSTSAVVSSIHESKSTVSPGLVSHGSTSATVPHHAAPTNGLSSSATTSPSPAPPRMPRVMSDGALSSCVHSVNVTPTASLSPPPSLTMSITQTITSHEGPRDVSVASVTTNQTLSVGSLQVQHVSTTTTMTSGIRPSSSTSSLTSSNRLPIKPALKRCCGSWSGMQSVCPPHFPGLNHLDLAGRITPNRLQNVTQAPWEAISPPATQHDPNCERQNTLLGGLCACNGKNEAQHTPGTGCGNACTLQCPASPSGPRPRLTFKDVVERRIYVSDSEYSIKFEPLDGTLYARRRPGRRSRHMADRTSPIMEVDTPPDEEAIGSDASSMATGTHRTLSRHGSRQASRVSLSDDMLEHLRPQDHHPDLQKYQDQANTTSTSKQRNSGSATPRPRGRMMYIPDDDEDDDIHVFRFGMAEDEDEDEDEDEEDEEEEEDEEDISNTDPVASHRRRRRRKLRNTPNAGQRAAAAAGYIIYLINETFDLIHWIAGVRLDGYYI